MPEWTATRHALARMRERGVPDEAVTRVLDAPMIQRPAGSRRGAPPADILIGLYEGRRLRVYVERNSSPPRVKSAAWED